MTLRPCLTCGEPAEGSRCPEHTPTASELRRTSARERGYDTAHDRLSKRARRLQPFCGDCGTDQNLTLHHTEEAWRRHDAHKPARLRDYEVLCQRHNDERGSTRPTGGEPPRTALGPTSQAKSRLLSGNFDRRAD